MWAFVTNQNTYVSPPHHTTTPLCFKGGDRVGYGSLFFFPLLKICYLFLGLFPLPLPLPLSAKDAIKMLNWNGQS